MDKLKLFSGSLSIFLLSILVTSYGLAQVPSDSFDKLALTIDSQAAVFLNPENSDSTKEDAFYTMHANLGKALQNPGTFTYPFDSTKRISILTSADNLVRLYTYHFKSSNGQYHQAGYVQYRSGADIRVFSLTNRMESSRIMESEGDVTWRGALYYQIITMKYKGEATYTLLGWNGNDALSTKKIIDVFYINDEGDPVFGKPVFIYPKSVTKEFVAFEYSAEVQMTLVYEEENKSIVFDHLSPQSPAMTGIFAYYGPDLSYDAFVWEKGKWLYKADYDARLDKNLKDRFFEMKLQEQKPIFKNP